MNSASLSASRGRHMVPVHQKFVASVRRAGVSAAAALTLLLVALPATPRAQDPTPAQVEPQDVAPDFSQDAPAHIAVIDGAATLDRKSTRLNSSHSSISYAV